MNASVSRSECAKIYGECWPQLLNSSLLHQEILHLVFSDSILPLNTDLLFTVMRETGLGKRIRKVRLRPIVRLNVRSRIIFKKAEYEYKNHTIQYTVPYELSIRYTIAAAGNPHIQKMSAAIVLSQLSAAFVIVARQDTLWLASCHFDAASATLRGCHLGQ